MPRSRPRSAALPGWERQGDEIVRTFECASFPDAVAFVVRVGFFAEAADHHPDLDIRWRKVRVALTTHDAGGLTQLDVDLAAQITQAFARFEPRPDMALWIALGIILALLFVLWIAFGLEPGPGAGRRRGRVRSRVGRARLRPALRPLG